MKFIKYFTFIFLANLLFSQFSLKGTIENYNEKIIFIYKIQNNDQVLLDKITTDNNGEFNYNVNEKFHGILQLYFDSVKKTTLLFTDNEDINFNAVNSLNEIQYSSFKDKQNEAYLSYLNKGNNDSKIGSINDLKKKYNYTDSFYKTLESEIKRLKEIPTVEYKSFPMLNYYITTEKNYILKQISTLDEAETLSNSIKEALINDGDLLEKSNLMTTLLQYYLSYKVAKYEVPEERAQAIETATNELVEDAYIETTRGQSLLLTSIKLLKGIGYNYIADRLISKASNLKCEITSDLKQAIQLNDNIKIGKVSPNFNFSKTSSTKYKDLYDIQSKYKLLIFWGSWCSHCQQEKPDIINFYKEFKEKGGEIISFGIESNLKEYQNFNADIPWITDTDGLYWSSPLVRDYNVDGTPTFFLLDKDNKILDIQARIEFIKLYDF